MNAGTMDKMRTAIERGLPVIFSNYSMAGASTPLTPAGTLALLLAELLAGLTVSQIIKEGAPILLGMLPVFFDLKAMTTFYDPQSILINLACAEMMAHYHLPHCGTSGSGTGWGADLIAADTYWMNSLTYCMVGGGLAPFVGDTLGSKVFSPKTVVYAHEVIDQSRRLAAGFELDDDHAVLDEIDRAGAGGSFLSAPSTRKSYRSAYYPSPVFARWSMERWRAAGGPPADRVLGQYTAELIATSPAPEDAAELLAKGEAFIAGRPS
jgi:trimethylamine--corrinoid protein Co-methyltransferase